MVRKKNDIALHTVKEVSVVGEDKSFLQNWAKRNADTFERAMELVFEENPYKFAELYLKVIKESKDLPVPQKINATINQTNNTQINKLDAASEIQDTSWRRNGEFAVYEDI